MPTLLIHKYDKSNPNYIQDWISISDIGKIFYGTVLTLDKYLKIENSYIQTIHEILDFMKIDTLEIRAIEKGFSLQYIRKNSLINAKQASFYQMLDNGVYLTQNGITEAIKLNLREALWCRLYNPKIEVNFGYDYYMGITVAEQEKIEIFKKIIEKHGLYWQEFTTSPFKLEEEFKKAKTFFWGDGQTNPSGDYHHDLRISKDDPLNRTYTEWSHFDEIENGLDWEEYQAVEQKYLQLVLDFLEFFQINHLAVNGGLEFTSIQELSVPAHYFSPQEETLFQQLQEYDETVEDWTVESFMIPKEDFTTLFQLIFKGRFYTWISTASITIQFDSSYRLYLSFYGHKKEIQQLVEKHGLYWQERQPPYKKAVGFR
ncbi:hypothetical protein [Streptococcus danieliae]|nr:hypothetical protein [Streptococcus danieliae]